MDRNKVNIEIFGLRTVGLIDTGAAISCISENLISKFKNNKIKFEETNSMNIYGVGGEEHKVKGKVTIPLKFKGLVVNYTLYVIVGLQYPLILGDDFLSDNKCNIHYPSRTLYLHDQTWQVALISTKGGKAKTAKSCTIPANNIAEIPVLIPKAFLNDIVLLEPIPQLAKAELLGASCLVRTTMSKARIQIINPNDKPITLPKFYNVADISKVDAKSVQNLSDEKKNCKKLNTVGSIGLNKNPKKSKIDFDLSSSNLTNGQKLKLTKFLDKNRDIFANDMSELGMTNIGFH